VKVLHVNHIDLLGRRFNGYDLGVALHRDGIQATQMVLTKQSNDENVIDISKLLSNSAQLRSRINHVESELSIRAMLFPFGHVIENHSAFLNADIVHYQLIYHEVLSLAQFPKLTRTKPSLLSIHDCTLLTGHCVHPMSCNLFETGCVDCPDINRIFAMKEDKSALMWAVKKRLFEDAKVELVAGSRWMRDMIKRSPVLSHLKTHFIQFGIDVDFYAGNRDNPRKKLNIPEDAFVVFLCAQSVLKGLDHIKNALDLMDTKPFVISCGQMGCFDNYQGGVKEFGIVTDDNIMAELFKSCDVFLMPSTGESFGFMAIECMSSGKPIIVADGTALPDVTFAPDCGISIPQGDAEALKNAIEQLRDNTEERAKRGLLGQKLAHEHYRFEDYYKKHRQLYEDLSTCGTTVLSNFKPLVSIIIPVYNGSNYMRFAIDSALGQTYKNCEVLVINDGSNDGGKTEEIALSYGNKIRYFSKENGGVATALNMGIDNMRGEYFSWLSHDDVYMPEKIEKQLEHIATLNKPEAIVYCGYYAINENSQITEKVDPALHYGIDKLNISLFPLFKDFVHGCSLLIHKSHFERVGKLDTSLATTQDYSLWYKMFRGVDVRYVPGCFVHSRIHSEQTSREVKNHYDNCDELWINMLSGLSEEEMQEMEGSKLNFYRVQNVFLKTTPYKKVKEYVKMLYENALKEEREKGKSFNPLVSIVIPVYNGSNYLREAIDSALAQTYDNIEIIVVNDGSKDNTGDIALSYGDKIRYFAKENGGTSTALNLGIEKMRGDYFSWLSHDDLYHPTKIARAVEELELLDDKNTIIVSDLNGMDEDYKIIYSTDYRAEMANLPTKEVPMLFPVVFNKTHGCTHLISKEVFERVGLFDVNWRVAHDFEFYNRAFAVFPHLLISEKLVTARDASNRQGRRAQVRANLEYSLLYIGILEQMDETEMLRYASTKERFFAYMREFFDDASYSLAMEYLSLRARDEGFELDIATGKKNVEDSIEQFREFSKLLYDVSEDFQAKLWDTSRSYEAQIQALHNHYQRQNPFKLLFVQAVRFAFRCIRKVISVLGLKEPLKRSRAYKALQKKGIFDKLNRRRSS
jgi:glycosyltransferase involved in cell wall biosynthesis